MRNIILTFVVLLCIPSVCFGGVRVPVIFATFAGDEGQLRNALVMTESVRTFGGAFKDAPVRVYAPENLLKAEDKLAKNLVALGAEVRTAGAPEPSLDFGYARKVFAAAKAEAEAKGAAAILAWMDDDTVVLEEPRELMLARGKSLGYRPVMHRNIGLLYSEKPNPFWSRLYRDLAVPASAVFPMKTAVDGATIRPYFNAGLLVVRPERGIMAKWAQSFSVLYRDRAIVDMCAKDRSTRVFLHQAALAGAILKLLARDEMAQLSSRYNYPLFFKSMYGAAKEFDSLDGVVTLRYDVYFQNPTPDWDRKLKGPASTISWLAGRLGNVGGRGEDASTKMRFRFQHRGGSGT